LSIIKKYKNCKTNSITLAKMEALSKMNSRKLIGSLRVRIKNFRIKSNKETFSKENTKL